jgi:hypothetical protein
MPAIPNVTEMLNQPLTTKSLALDVSSEDADFTDSEGDYYMPPFARRLYVGTAGDVEAKKMGDADFIVYKNVPAGSYLDGAWIAVGTTNTTATDIIAEQ